MNNKLLHWKQHVSTDVTFKGDKMTIQIGKSEVEINKNLVEKWKK